MGQMQDLLCLPMEDMFTAFTNIYSTHRVIPALADDMLYALATRTQSAYKGVLRTASTTRNLSNANRYYLRTMGKVNMRGRIERNERDSYCVEIMLLAEALVRMNDTSMNFPDAIRDWWLEFYGHADMATLDDLREFIENPPSMAGAPDNVVEMGAFTLKKPASKTPLPRFQGLELQE